MENSKIIDFIKKNYCDIEATKLPKTIGVLPAKERLLKKKQMEALIEKAKQAFGKEFAEFLEMNFVKTSVPQGKRMLRFFWLNFDNWIFFYYCWLGRQTAANETPPDYFTD